MATLNHSKEAPTMNTWLYTGIVAGLIACISYPLAISVPLQNHQLILILGASFGPALAIASFALGRILLQRHASVSAQLGALSNIIAGALVTVMIIVQLAVRYSTVPSQDPELEKFVVKKIWDVVLGLDVAFDVFIGLGTIFFGFSMLRDRRFGKAVGLSGIFIGGIVVLGFNFYSFPIPPKDAGLLDSGPISGLWYTIVTILIIYYTIRSRKMTEI